MRRTEDSPVVAIDATAAARAEPSGAGRYARGLVAALLRRADSVRYQPLYKSWRPIARALSIPPEPSEAAVPGRWVLSIRAAVFHLLDPRPWLPRRVPSAVTVFDLFSLEHDDLAPPRFRARKRRAYAVAAARAARIIALTDAVARRLASRFPGCASRIRVVPPGIEPVFRPLPPDAVGEGLARLGVRRPYILVVGEVCPRKGLPVVAEAVGALRGRDPGLVLVAAGRASWGADEELRRARARGPVQTLGYVSDEALAVLYAGARAVAIGSRDEGFGFPAVEAMACGAPVIASDVEALREVASDAALFVPPGDAGGFAAAIERVREDGALRAHLRERGAARASVFRWDESAARVAEIHREIRRARE
ncbi:MAG: glycosyltransferase family 4 protein [Planctomycetes bacterium]|nr:glycosyltransferase family 4 protein [Planctomycetota bacterium]